VLVGSTNQESFKSVHSTLYFVVVHECNLRLGKQESQLLLGCADRRLSLISEGQRPMSGRGKKAIFHSDYSLIYAMVTRF